MKLYTNIKRQYNKDTNNKVKQLRKLNSTIIKAKNSITFLLRCRNSGLTPNFLLDATKNIEYMFENQGIMPYKIKETLTKYLDTLQMKLLNLMIDFKHNTLRKKEAERKENQLALITILSDEDHTLLRQSEENMDKKLELSIKQKHVKKFEKLRDRQREELQMHNNHHWFMNKTESDIPINTQWLLSLGDKFALPTTKADFPLFKFIADGESCIRTLDDREEQEIARMRFTTQIDRHINTHTDNKRDKAILNTVEQTRKFLNKNPNIIITNSDKGNKTVAISKTEYNDKMKTILGDMMTYRRLKKDPTTNLQQMNNDLVQKLHEQDVITLREKYTLTQRTAVAPRIYGLPKIHKENTPLRPICSSINSPSYNLCKYVIKILNNLTVHSKYNIKDAIQFKQKVNNMKLEPDEKLISFDVVSLFPSIPVDYAMKIIEGKWDIIRKHTSMTKELFLDIIRFCIKDNRYFVYDDKIFRQMKGMPMGSPASPVIADIVLEDLLDKCLNKMIIKPRLLTKYVDDIFAIVKTTEINKTLKLLNDAHKDIKFTMEEETDNKLAYLDTLIIRCGNEIKLDWYRKPMASGRLINFHSKHPKSVKINTARNFIRRVLAISDKIYHKANKHKIKTILTMNNFPSKVINGLIRDNNSTKNNKNDENEKIYKSIPYISKFSERIRSSNVIDEHKYAITMKTHNTVKNLYTNTKSKIDKYEKHNVIYQITCNGNNTENCDMKYVGTTKSKLKTRISGHKSNVKSQDSTKTALSAHCASRKHTPNFATTKILQQENNYNKRFTLEMLHISNTPRDKRLNFKTDTESLAHCYRHLIKREHSVNKR